MSFAEAKEESTEGTEVREETEKGLLKMSGQSQVYTATRDTLFSKITPRRTHALVCMSVLLNVYI